MKISFELNGSPVEIDIADPNTPLLWVIRDYLNLKGTKYGCGKAACGACTIHVDDVATRSCVLPVQFAAGKRVITIEGLGSPENPHPVQQAWIEDIVPQCGYCQPGFIMSAAALLKANPNPDDRDIDQAILNICRCGTYYRMRKAIHKAASLQNQSEDINGEG